MSRDRNGPQLKNHPMRNRIIIFTAITTLIFCHCKGPRSPDPQETHIQALLDTLLMESPMQAISAGIIQGDKVYEIHRGKLLDGKSPDANTLYEIASLTKTFTGTLLANAMAEQKVNLDDDVRQYLRDSLPNLEYEGHPVTFRHLVTHQSGLPHMLPDIPGLFDHADWDELPFKINELQEGFSRGDFFTALSGVRLDTLPGIGLSYSNAGANLTGYVLEEIYHKPFAEILSEKILNPLKMDHTGISRSRVPEKQLAEGQNVNQVRMPYRAEKNMNAEGGILSNTGDMIRYMQYHLDESNEVVALSHQHLWEGKYGDFEAGIFWQINKNGDQPDRIFQNGGAFGTSSWITLIPEENLGVFLITNIAGQGIHQQLSETAEKIMVELHNKPEKK